MLRRASWDQVGAAALGCSGANARSRAKSVSAIRSSAATVRRQSDRSSGSIARRTAPRSNSPRRAGAICAAGSLKGLTVVPLRSAPVRTLSLRTCPRPIWPPAQRVNLIPTCSSSCIPSPDIRHWGPISWLRRPDLPRNGKWVHRYPPCCAACQLMGRKLHQTIEY